MQLTWKQVYLFPLFMLLYIHERWGGGLHPIYKYIYREKEPFDWPTTNQMEDDALLNIKA